MKKIVPNILSSLIISAVAIVIYHFGYVKTQTEVPNTLSLVENTMVDSKPNMPIISNVNDQSNPLPAGIDFKKAARITMPAVVHIKSNQRSTSRRSYSLWDEYFGNGNRREGSRTVSTGSGVIISSDGFIVTNNHVIADADELEVTLFDNRSFKASVIGTDPTTDLGLIKLETSALPYVQLANSDNAEVGEWVLAVGNPFNLASTATAGIVSAIGRDLEIIKDNQSKAIESFIQTDAAVNPGNSGGALVNMEGQLLGINTAIASPTGAYAGYAFAVPANIVRKVVEDLKEYGTVQRAYLGVSGLQNMNTQIADKMGLDISEGVVITQVPDQGGAAQAGIQEGDVVVEVDGIKIKNEAKLLELIARNRPGDNIEVVVNRKGNRKSFNVQLTDVYGKTVVSAIERKEILTELGVEFSNLDQREKESYDLDNGVKVAKLVAGKIRSQTEMKENFIITKINGDDVGNSEALIRRLERSRGDVVLEGFYHRGRYLYQERYTIEL